MRQCFDSVTVHGLPMLSIPDGESVDYPFLNGRFKDGLDAISNSIVQRLNTPRIVTVAGNAMVLNATHFSYPFSAWFIRKHPKTLLGAALYPKGQQHRAYCV